MEGKIKRYSKNSLTSKMLGDECILNVFPIKTFLILILSTLIEFFNNFFKIFWVLFFIFN